MKKLSYLIIALCLGMVLSAGAGAAEGAATEADLIGKTYILESVDGKPYEAERQPFIEFRDDFMAAGRICNTFRGPGQLVDGVLRVGPMAATMMLCPQEGLSDLEARVFKLLDAGMTATWENDSLVLRAEGAELVFRKDAPEREVAEADLRNRKFVLVSVGGEAFTADNQPYISFGEDLRVAGQACNLFNGQAELRNGILYIENAVSTMKMCIDEKLNRYERDFHTLVREGARVTMDGTTLTLKGGDLEFVYEEEEK